MPMKSGLTDVTSLAPTNTDRLLPSGADDQRAIYARVILSCLGLALLTACGGPAAPVDAPQADIAHPPTPAERAQVLVKQMTLDEKLAYIGGDRDFYIRPIERLGIPEIKMADGPVGCRNWGASTAYPASIGLAASFDPELTQQVGASIARDCRARGVHILLAPGTNIQRSPLNGRNFEYLGEDPYLARDHVVSFITGVQGGGVMATVKHFVANNQEWDRHHVSSEVSERALNEIYFPAFEGAVKQAQVGAVMTSYNLLNGAYASHNTFLLRETLRARWKFEGLVMSDWSAIHDALGGVRGGTDLEMPRSQVMNAPALKQLLKDGKIKEADIDEKVFHILRALIAFGFFDRPQLVEQVVDDPQSAAIALKAALSSVVLLKNDVVVGVNKSGTEKPILPLDARSIKRIAVVGPNASPAVHGGSGSAYTVPSHVVSLLDGIKAQVPNAVVQHHPGIIESTGFGALGQPVFARPVTQEIFLGKKLAGESVYVSHVDRVNMRADGGSPAPNVPSEDYSIRWTGTINVEIPDTYQLMVNADDGVRVFLDGQLVIDDFTDHAPRMKDVELKLKKGEHAVVIEYFQGILGSICQFGFGKKTDAGSLTGETELTKIARAADVVIVAVGYGQNADTNSMGSAYEPFWPPEWARQAGIVEAEDDDRGFALPKPQQATIQAVSKVNKNTIVIGFSGGGVDFEPWLDQVQALLWAWYPGQEGGTALAKTLFGQNNPSARLPITFAQNYGDHPAANSYGLGLELGEERERGVQADLSACSGATSNTMDIRHKRTAQGEGPLYKTPYCDDVFVGYRGFDKAGTEPLFPFGFGLSYATFNYSDLVVKLDDHGQVLAELTVANTGLEKGRDIVQLYVAPMSNGPSASAPRAPQQLAGYQAVDLQPGVEQRIRLSLNPRAFAFYQTQGKKGWLIPKGSYEVRASRSSRNHQLQSIINLEGGYLNE